MCINGECDTNTAYNVLLGALQQQKKTTPHVINNNCKIIKSLIIHK